MYAHVRPLAVVYLYYRANPCGLISPVKMEVIRKSFIPFAASVGSATAPVVAASGSGFVAAAGVDEDVAETTLDEGTAAARASAYGFVRYSDVRFSQD